MSNAMQERLCRAYVEVFGPLAKKMYGPQTPKEKAAFDTWWLEPRLEGDSYVVRVFWGMGGDKESRFLLADGPLFFYATPYASALEAMTTYATADLEERFLKEQAEVYCGAATGPEPEALKPLVAEFFRKVLEREWEVCVQLTMERRVRVKARTRSQAQEEAEALVGALDFPVPDGWRVGGPEVVGRLRVVEEL